MYIFHFKNLLRICKTCVATRYVHVHLKFGCMQKVFRIFVIQKSVIEEFANKHPNFMLRQIKCLFIMVS